MKVLAFSALVNALAAKLPRNSISRTRQLRKKVA